MARRDTSSEIDWTQCELIEQVPGKVSGRPIVRGTAEKALPFEPLDPNAETVAAMKAARRGELVKAGKPDTLLQNLNA
jgi:hypothetical protein